MPRASRPLCSLMVNLGAVRFTSLDAFRQGLTEFLIGQEYAVKAYSARQNTQGEPLFSLNRIEARTLASIPLSEPQQLSLSSLYTTDITRSKGLLGDDNALVTRLSSPALVDGREEMSAEQWQNFLNDFYLKKHVTIKTLPSVLTPNNQKLRVFYRRYVNFLSTIEEQSSQYYRQLEP